MKNIRKIICVLLAAVMLFALTACDEATEQTATTATTTAAAKETTTTAAAAETTAAATEEAAKEIELKALKVGVLREDDSSGEALAWEAYMKTVGAELNITFDFITTDSSTAEVSAINTYASKGYDAIFSYSDDDVLAQVQAAQSNEMYIAIPTGQPTDEIYQQIKDLSYYLGNTAPNDDIEYQAGYDMAKYFVEQREQANFTIFGGATCWAVSMHVQRLVGILAYLCEDEGTDYDGAKTRWDLVAKVAGQGVDPAKFNSSKYVISGYMDGFDFDDAFSTKLTNSLNAGGTCVLAVGATDAVTGIGYGITQQLGTENFMTGGVDAITDAYTDYFYIGYSYDCGKYASAVAPAIILLESAVNGQKITEADGSAPMVAMNYWVADSLDTFNEILSVDNADNGYCYNAAVIKKYIGASLEDFTALCAADYNTSKTISASVN